VAGDRRRRPVPRQHLHRRGLAVVLAEHDRGAPLGLRQRGRHPRDGVGELELYDRDLRRLFSDAPEHARHPSAARFLSRLRKEAGRRVRRWTGSYQYLIDRVLGEMIERCRQLNLRLAAPEEQARQDFLVLLAVRVVNDRGEVRGFAAVTDHVAPGTVVVPFGRWLTDGPGANALTADRIGDLGGGPTFCDALVEVLPGTVGSA